MDNASATYANGNEQAVIVIICVVSVKCEQWDKSSDNNKELN